MQFKNTPYRIVPLARCILAKLYVELVNDADHLNLSDKQIAGLFKVHISLNLIRSSLEFLRTNHYSEQTLLTRHGNREKGYTYSITAQGIREVEKSSRDKSTDISYFLAHGDESLDQIAGPDAIFWSRDEFAEVSDWTPIAFDENDTLYEEALNQTEQALDEIEKSNELSANFPAQKEGLVSSLRLGLERLRSLRPTKSELQDLIVKPLKWVASNFATSAVGQAAKIAAQKIIDLIVSTIFG